MRFLVRTGLATGVIVIVLALVSVSWAEYSARSAGVGSSTALPETVADGASGTLIDEVFPEYHIGEKHSIFIEAPPERVFESLKSAGGYERPVLRLFSVLPVIAGNADAPLISEEKPIYERLRSGSGLVLEEPNRELVVADIGTANGPASSMPDTAQEFFTYRLGYNQMKGAVNLRVDTVEGGSRLTTETRMMYGGYTSCQDFGRYWGSSRH